MNNPDPLLQELLAEFDLNWAEDDVPRLREYARNKLTSAVLRTWERVLDEAVSVVPEGTNRYYDGNNLESAAEKYGLAANNWTEIIRFENGWNACRFATLEALTALKETNPSTP